MPTGPQSLEADCLRQLAPGFCSTSALCGLAAGCNCRRGCTHNHTAPRLVEADRQSDHSSIHPTIVETALCLVRLQKTTKDWSDLAFHPRLPPLAIPDRRIPIKFPKRRIPK